MNKKILPLLIGTLLSAGANANSAYMSVIDRFEKEGGFVSAPVAKLSYLYLEETDQDTTFNLPITFSNGKPTNGSVDYEIVHLTTTDDDIVLDSGTLTIGMGHPNTVPVTIKGDYILESDETFRVTLSNPKLVTIPSGSESYDYTIVDNDTVPTISVKDLTVIEGDIDITANVVVELSKPSGFPFSIDYSTEVGTATTLDFENTSGTLNFAAGELQKTFSVIIKGDTLDEVDETFKVKISNPTLVTIDEGEAIVTIEDNDEPPRLTIEDTTFIEGDELENKILMVTLSKESSKDIQVDFTTSTGTADSSDFVEEAKTITILAGETTGDITIQVNGDYTMEDNETLNVTLSNPKEVIIDTETAIITLDNDDTEYEFNTLPIYGKVEYQNKNDGTWTDVIANYGYERDIQFRYNPTESEVLAVSRDINIGSFDTDTSTPGIIDGTHGLYEWGTTSGNKSTFTENGVTVTTVLSDGDIKFDQTNKGLGSSEFSNANPSTNYYEIESPMKFTINLEGDFLNDIKITAAALGGCFDIGQSCETRVSVDAYDENNNLLSSQGGYRQSGIAVDSYYFTGETPIKKFLVYPTPTNVGGNNSNLSSGNFVLTNMTVSRSAFEVIDYKYKDIDGTVSTETINLNINEGNANTNVDINQYLLGQ